MPSKLPNPKLDNPPPPPPRKADRDALIRSIARDHESLSGAIRSMRANLAAIGTIANPADLRMIRAEHKRMHPK